MCFPLIVIWEKSLCCKVILSYFLMTLGKMMDTGSWSQMFLVTQLVLPGAGELPAMIKLEL